VSSNCSASIRSSASGSARERTRRTTRLASALATATATASALALACGGDETGTPDVPSDSQVEDFLESIEPPPLLDPIEAMPIPARPRDSAGTKPPVRESPEVAARRAAAGAIDDARLARADADLGNWIATGRDQGEQRFSPLTQVHANNAARLQLAWSFPTGLDRGHEATPLAVNGVLYFTGSWSVVFALEAKTGRELWRFDPGVSPEVGRITCCDVVNRGVAIYEGKLFLGALDGRLIALDAATGDLVWETLTVDQSLPYTITGAPRIADGKVIIGNGGAEFGVRGYVSAYSPETGELVWRTYTVPGDPAQPFESEALEKAADTWKGGEWWKVGGGGTVWDSMAYDPELDLLYVGTGNGSPWSRYIRSPGGGDNLYLSSILALDPQTGEIQWHYQTTPGDNYDYTATQHMILADLEVGGRTRQVIMQAPKNGFFYVLDRKTGEFLSAENYVGVSWAHGVDPETGRPIRNEDAEYRDGAALVQPMYLGGHNWQPMSFNPVTGLVYIPAQEMAGAFALDPGYAVRPGEFNTAVDNKYGALFDREIVSGHLLAWDPVKQREAWRHPHGLPWNGGTLTTAGNLVFQGTADGRFLALRADDGYLLWTSHSAGTGIIAAPITYMVDGTQYITVVAGWGGAYAQVAGDASAAAGSQSGGRVLTYALATEAVTMADIDALMEGRPEELKAGADLYHTWCFRCHGANAIAGGVNPDLRRAIQERPEAFEEIVTHGLPGTSMPAFAAWVTPDEIAEIERYVQSQTP